MIDADRSPRERRHEPDRVAFCASDEFRFALRADGRLESAPRTGGEALDLGSLPFYAPHLLSVVHLVCRGDRFAAVDARSGEIAFGNAPAGVLTTFRPRHPGFEELASRAAASAASVGADPATNLILLVNAAALDPQTGRLFLGLTHSRLATEGFAVLSLNPDGADERLHRLAAPMPAGADSRYAGMAPHLVAAGGGRIAVADRRGLVALYPGR